MANSKKYRISFPFPSPLLSKSSNGHAEEHERGTKKTLLDGKGWTSFIQNKKIRLRQKNRKSKKTVREEMERKTDDGVKKQQ
jgi:hypothetical protein